MVWIRAALSQPPKSLFGFFFHVKIYTYRPHIWEICMYVYIYMSLGEKKIHIYKSISILKKHYSQRFYLGANNILAFFFSNYLYWINLPPYSFWSSCSFPAIQPGVPQETSWTTVIFFFIMEPYWLYPTENLTHNIKSCYRLQWG